MFVLLCCISIYFGWFLFFFKQKTAYEMRISDWSSDVCSSDLPATAESEIALLRQVLDARVPFFGICFGNQLLGRALGFGTYKLKYGHRGINQPEIGRASCRERVCQYV